MRQRLRQSRAAAEQLALLGAERRKTFQQFAGNLDIVHLLLDSQCILIE